MTNAMDEIVPLVKDINSIYNFITGGNMAKISSHMGDKEMNAVKMILRQINEEKDISNAVNRIMVHLESAYELYDDFQWFMHWQKKADTKKNYICAMMAICHRYQGNSDKIIATWLLDKAVYTHDYVIPTIPREMFYVLIKDEQFAKECADKRDKSFTSLCDGMDIMLPPSL